MFKMGEGFYRFKFEDFSSNLKVTKNFFKATYVEEPEPGSLGGTRYRFKCEEDPKVMYQDGLKCSFDEALFGSVKPCGSAIYVILKDDDEDAAVQLVKEHLADRVLRLRKNLDNAKAELRAVSSYEACMNGFDSSL